MEDDKTLMGYTIYEDDYETPWSKIPPDDYNLMKITVEELENPGISDEQMENILNNIQITLPNHPVDYFLQTPHVFLKLLKVWEKSKNSNCMLNETIAQYLKQLIYHLVVRSDISFYAKRDNALDAMGATQLKVSKAIELVLDQCFDKLNKWLLRDWKENIKHVKLIALALRIYDMECLVIPEKYIHLLTHMCEELQATFKNEKHFKSHRLKYLLLTGLLHDVLEQNSKLQEPKNQKSLVLEQLLFDYPFKTIFPKRYKHLAAFLCLENVELQKRCAKLNAMDEDFGIALQILKQPNSVRKNILQLGLRICYTLDPLGSKELAKILFKAIVKCRQKYLVHETVKDDALKLLDALLNLKSADIRAEMYGSMLKTMEEYIKTVTKIDAMNSIHTLHNVLHARHIIGVPLNSKILENMIFECHENNSVLHDELADMLTLLLKSHTMIGRYWKTFLHILLPVLPYMHCLANAPKLTKQLRSCYDSDVQIVDLSAKIQGNIRFLFHVDNAHRKESLTNLFSMINNRSDASEYLPIINKDLPNDICVIEPPRKMSSIFTAPDELQNDICSVLSGLYEQLNSHQCWSALLQLETLSHDWKTADIMLDDGMEIVAISMLKSAVRVENQCQDVNCKPAIGILSRMLLLDAQLRINLKDDIMLQVLLLRALFLLPNDMQMRQDASLCLFLLAFPINYDIQPPTNATSAIIKASSLLTSLKVPFEIMAITPRSELHATVLNEFQLSDIFQDPNKQSTYLRHIIYAELGTTTNIRDTLQATSWDYNFVRSTLPDSVITNILLSLCSTIDKKMQTYSITMSQMLFTLFDLLKVESTVSKELMEKFIKKFIAMLECVVDDKDFKFFEHLLETAFILTDAANMQFIESFIEVLQNPNHAIFELLEMKDMPLRLYTKLNRLLTKLAKLQENVEYTIPEVVIEFNKWLFISAMKKIQLLVEQGDKFRVRCLLMQLMERAAESLSSTDTELMTYYDNIIKISACEFLQDLKWQQNCLLLLGRLSRQIKNPERILKSAGPAIKIIHKLCGHSNIQFGDFTWPFMLTLASCSDQESGIVGSKLLISELSHLPGGLIAYSLSTLLNANETIANRSCAGNLFATLLRNASLDMKFVVDLLERNSFFTSAHNSLQYFTTLQNFPKQLRHDASEQREYIDSEIVQCYCFIIFTLINIYPSFLQLLAKQHFMFSLYEVLKEPVSFITASYYKMAVEVFNLYIHCNSEDFIFLKRNICRDELWVSKYFELLKHLWKFPNEYTLAKLIQTLQLLCSDEIAWAAMLENFSKMPHLLVGSFTWIFEVMNKNIPCVDIGLYTLSMLLCTKSAGSLVKILDNFTHEDIELTGAGLIFSRIFDVWKLQYPVKSHGLNIQPTNQQKMATMTLSQLLELSPQAQNTAKKVGLLDAILVIFNAFFDKHNIPRTGFLRRYGDEYRKAVIANFQLLLLIVERWQNSAGGMCITEEPLAEMFSEIMLRIWTWSVNSDVIKQIVLRISHRATQDSVLGPLNALSCIVESSSDQPII